MTANQFRNLSEALASFGSASILVVADEYPPDTVGGAEISLHEMLRHSGLLDEIAVVKFTGSTLGVSTYEHQGVRVMVLPGRAIWPKTTVQSKMAPPRVIRALSRAARAIEISRRHGLTRPRRAAIRLARAKQRPSGGLPLDGLVEKYEGAAAHLTEVLLRTGAACVFANNTRSIMTCAYSMKLHAESWEGAKTIAMVRDNRFYCVRHNQTMMVRGRVCTTCDLACAPVDAPDRPQDQTLVLDAARSARRSGLAQFDRVVTTSQFLVEQLGDVLNGRDKLSIVPNFAGDPREIQNAQAHVAERAKDVLVVIGSLNEAKGQREFVRSAEKHLQRNKNLEIHLLGKGPRMEKAIRKAIGGKDYAERVRFRGFLERDALYAAITEAKVVVLPTLWPEPFGRVPLEAGLCRKPVVAFDTGAYRETIQDGKTGLIVERGDYDALWRAIDDLVSDGVRRRRMGDAGHERITMHYSKQKSIDAFRATVEN